MSLIGKYGIRDSVSVHYLISKVPFLVVRETPKQVVIKKVYPNGEVDVFEETCPKSRFIKFVDTIDEFNEINKMNMQFNAVCEDFEKKLEEMKNSFYRQVIGEKVQGQKDA